MKKLNLNAGDRVIYIFDKMHAGYRKGRKVGGTVISKIVRPGRVDLYEVECDDGQDRRIAEDWLKADPKSPRRTVKKSMTAPMNLPKNLFDRAVTKYGKELASRIDRAFRKYSQISLSNSTNRELNSEIAMVAALVK